MALAKQAAVRTFIVLAVLAHVAAAEPLELTPPGLTPASPAPLPKDDGVALLLSLAGAVAPIAVYELASGPTDDEFMRGLVLASATMVITPSAGQWYAGRSGGWGMAIRFVGTATFLMTTASCYGYDCDWGPIHQALGYGGLAVTAIGVLYDMTSAPRAVDEWNRKHATLSVPTLARVGSGYGVALGGRF